MTKATDNLRWQKSVNDDDYLVSTSKDLVDRAFVQSAFASEETYWAKPLPDEQLTVLLDNSLTLGLYKVIPAAPSPKSAETPDSPRTPSPTIADDPSEQLQQIGMARLITDHMTTAYLTDVYILPDYRTHGLGKWLIKCCNETFDAMPAMRRTFLVTSPEVGKRFYGRELGMWDVGDEKEHLACMTRRFFRMD
ncbi:uncharacterized protein LTR77_000263 [Saxophila tyrrhenica]|uniref:N-acetyltransferase domain-containing protein n=1 Tax=Saxophila tyrrhenica TaxID=1690608 RepID=A0AAV9PMW8_9PEZI|nr:hypothetical protein LTR77_000263 [Saxophila tyrrhenica]